MAVVAKWLTHRIVAPTFVGSIPIDRPIKNAGVAQLVAHFTRNEGVGGSSPLTSTIQSYITKPLSKGFFLFNNEGQSGGFWIGFCPSSP